MPHDIQLKPDVQARLSPAITRAKTVFAIEIQALSDLQQRLGEAFTRAVAWILDCKGRVVFAGLGKSGHIARKLAATFASTGTPAFFIHASEANHGDAGMLIRGDILIALSYSGDTEELIGMLPLAKSLGVPVIAMCGDKNSRLAKMAALHLDIHVEKEACPLNLAPTSSTTAALVLGDALAVVLLKARGFTSHDFAMCHPGGGLGRRLLLTVGDVMRTGEHIPSLLAHTMLPDVLFVMTQRGLGCVAVVDSQNRLQGIYTDGDLRRTLEKNADIYAITLKTVMRVNPKTVTKNQLAQAALQLMERHKITVLCVISDTRELIGMVHIHDLLRAGLK